MYTEIFVCVILANIVIRADAGWSFVGNPLAAAHPCNGSEKVRMSYESGLSPDEENKYTLFITEDLPVHSKVKIQFDQSATVTLAKPGYARISNIWDNTFSIAFYKSLKGNLILEVKGTRKHVIPYPTSIDVNSEEYCKHPIIGVLDSLLQGERDTAEILLPLTPGPSCGRRKINHVELITNSEPSKPGDWPWHAAIYRYESGSPIYKCGGTLVSEFLVVTAAHCTTIRGVPLSPKDINVILGKYDLNGVDVTSQEREVKEVIVHDGYNATYLNNDIAILKLTIGAEFTNYVQPACIWDSQVLSRIGRQQLFGTVAGWGFDQSDKLSPKLRHAYMPKVPEAKCLRSNPLFFGTLLTDDKFCGGYGNGTSPCNGDSGGGFLVFAPDEPNNDNSNITSVPGSWYLRGVVSTGVARKNIAICDSYQYILFMDVAKYRDWIEKYFSK